MELVKEVSGALDRYFSSLKHLGYKSYDEVVKLLVLTFIEDLLYGPMSEFITEHDYNCISDCMQCLYGTCTIPYPSYRGGAVEPIIRTPMEYRATEDKTIRVSEDSVLRVKS